MNEKNKTYQELNKMRSKSFKKNDLLLIARFLKFKIKIIYIFLFFTLL